MSIRGTVSHVDLTVTDFARAVPFYDRLLTYLGFRKSGKGVDPVWYRRYDDGGSFSIALVLARPGSRDKQHDRYAPGLHHLAFRADSRDEVDRLHDLLREIGATVLDPPADFSDQGYGTGYYAVFFADPDGVKLEFVHLPEKPS
ncbi:MAG TPA: VOC family protein [Candidatus Binataceae bacterium]